MKSFELTYFIMCSVEEVHTDRRQSFAVQRSNRARKSQSKIYTAWPVISLKLRRKIRALVGW